MFRPAETRCTASLPAQTRNAGFFHIYHYNKNLLKNKTAMKKHVHLMMIAAAAITAAGCGSPAARTAASITPAGTDYGAGTVQFSVSWTGTTSVTDATGGATVTGGYGTASFASSLSAGATCYAQSRDTRTGCVSATRLPVAGTVVAIPAAPAAPTQNGPACSPKESEK
jgi:hypothetical protein